MMSCAVERLYEISMISRGLKPSKVNHIRCDLRPNEHSKILLPLSISSRVDLAKAGVSECKAKTRFKRTYRQALLIRQVSQEVDVDDTEILFRDGPIEYGSRSVKLTKSTALASVSLGSRSKRGGNVRAKFVRDQRPRLRR